MSTDKPKVEVDRMGSIYNTIAPHSALRRGHFLRLSDMLPNDRSGCCP